ncbi:MAG: amidohydrolase family protein [Candidatus Lustribacter sp.]|jgi:predicted TIM-barrel fold metal-dependent hydrolase
MEFIKAYDCDSHVEEWEGTFSDAYLEPAFRDRRPIVVETGEFEHDYVWLIDGNRIRLGGSPSSKNGVPSTEYSKMARWRGPLQSGEFRSAADRLAVMDAEDAWLSVNYPTLLLRSSVAKDPALNQALVRAYNNWIADISSEAPERLKWVTVIDVRDPKAAAAEMIRTAEMGSVGVMVLGVYGDKLLDDPDFTPIWETANDLGMPVNVHLGSGGGGAARNPASVSHNVFINVVRGFETICSSGLLDRYPNVRVSFLETTCTWVDFAVKEMNFTLDNIRERIKLGTLRAEHRPIVERGLPKMTPLEYMQAGRIFINFEIDDELLPYMVNRYGIDCWMYAADLPHAHRKTNAVRSVLDRPDLPDEAKKRILWEGTSRLYGFQLPSGSAAALS